MSKDISDERIVEVNGLKYYQPECNCDSNGHICYLRPVSQVVNMKLSDITKSSGSNVIKPQSISDEELKKAQKDMFEDDDGLKDFNFLPANVALDEIFFLKFSIDSERDDLQYPIISRKDIDEAKQDILNLIERERVEAWHEGAKAERLEQAKLKIGKE